MDAFTLTGPKPKFSFEEKTLGHFFFNRGEKHGNKICQIDGTTNTSETFSSLKQRSVKVAIALQKCGVTSSDVITFCSPNTLDVVVPIVASCYLGAKIANLDVTLSIRHTKHLLEIVTPKIIFVDENAVGLIEESLIGTTFYTNIIVFGSSSKYTIFNDLLIEDENEKDFLPFDVDPEDIGIMFFSSGTTGLPKAIAHSHRSFLLGAANGHQYGFVGTIFHFASMYWMTAMTSLVCCYNFGTPRVFCRNPSTEDIFRIIQNYKIESMFIPPTLTYKLTSFEKADQYDTSSLKVVMCGGTVIATHQLKKTKNLFKTAFVSSGYGMSEVNFVACFDPDVDVDLAEKKLTSCGKPAAGVRLKIVDSETGKLLGPTEKGEICVISPTMFKGYYHDKFPKVFDKDGFLKTGDIGYYDDDGCIYVVERLKDMFKYKSWHIVPSAVEAVLLEHPSIKEVAVFGIPHEEDGDVPAACIVLGVGGTISEDEIDKFLKTRVSDRERLRGGVTFLESLPKTPSGKIKRRKVREMFLNSTFMQC